MIEFSEAIPAILDQETDSFEQRNPEKYLASRIGFCPRQLYLSKLGLLQTGSDNGKYRMTNLIQQYLEDRIQTRHSGLEAGVSCVTNEGQLQFIGRCNLFDPVNKIAYMIKARNGWYQFTPPVDRHIDQLQIYLRGLGVERGKIIYISKNNLADVREYPEGDSDEESVAFESERYETLVEKAQTIREAIWDNGIASSAEEIPFTPCGCYFCQNESLAFQTPTAPNDQPNLKPEHSTPTTDQSAANESTNDPTEGKQSKSASFGSDLPTETPCNEEGLALRSEEQHIPRDLREHHVWVVWDGQMKRALAPWQEGSMYPCEWAATKDIDPRRSFETAQMVAELPPREVHKTWPFPDEDNLPDEVLPAILLPHDPAPNPITFVDFDDVRDPDSGRVTEEVVQLIDALGGYAELSRSGTGLHVYVRGGLPEKTGMVTGQLEVRGQIEIYDHGRFTGGTWQYVKGTPRDTLPEVQDTIEEIIHKYSPRV